MLSKFLKSSDDLICSIQQFHGFRSGRSCLTQLLHHFDDAMESLTNNLDFDSIYLDFAQAFDKVDHEILMKKLQLYGIHPKIINWIRSFLTNRMQGVEFQWPNILSGHDYQWSSSRHGARPDSFLIFINDIAHCVSDSIIRCFADDTRVSKAIIGCEEDVSTLQSDIIKVIQWSDNNNMSLHKDKFEYISYQHNRHNTLTELHFICKQFQYWVSDTTVLRPTLQLRDLGVTMASDLSSTHYILDITSKARQKAAWVLSVFHSRSPEIMLTLQVYGPKLIRVLLPSLEPH